MKKNFTLIFCSLSFFAMAQPSSKTAAAFTAGNVVVYRAGTGSGALTNAATAVVLDEYSPAGTLVQSVAMPVTVSGNNKALTCAGNATAEGLMSRSQDGRYLMVPGYDAAPGTATIATSPSATNNRVVGRIDAAGTINTTTALNDAFNNSNIRGAASTNGIDIWMSNNGTGVRYASFGSTTSTIISNSPTTLRSVHIFNNQLYVGTGTAKVATIGTGLPTEGAGDVAVGLPGMAATGAYQFFFADLSPSIPGDDVVYVADDAAAPAGGIQKYSFDGTNWNSNGVIVPPAVIKGLAAYVSGTSVTLYSSSATNIYKTTDATGYNGTITATFTTIATAPANTAFRGLAPAPVPNALPLDILSFKGALSDNNVLLNFTSANEVNVKSYTIERSNDSKSFTAIGSVTAANRSENNYSFIDNAPLNGIAFYRLQATDKDGAVKYSAVISINNQKGIHVQIFPNPATSNITVKHTKASTNGTIKVMNTTGQLIKSFKVQEGAVQTSFLINDLSAGNYLLIFENDGEKNVSKFVVKK